MLVHRLISNSKEPKSSWKYKDVFLHEPIAVSLSHSWKTSQPISWCLFWSVICLETAATPECCGRCCWPSYPSCWIQLWTSWLTWSVTPLMHVHEVPQFLFRVIKMTQSNHLSYSPWLFPQRWRFWMWLERSECRCWLTSSSGTVVSSWSGSPDVWAGFCRRRQEGSCTVWSAGTSAVTRTSRCKWLSTDAQSYMRDPLLTTTCILFISNIVFDII